MSWLDDIAEWLSRITLTCFAACYVIAMILETTRLFFRARVRNWAVIALLAVGLLTQTVYLWTLIQSEVGRIVPAARWYDWCLMAAWVLAAASLMTALRRPQTAVSLFFLPPILILIGAAYLLVEAAPFSRAAAISIWGIVHGLALLLGTVTVAMGFAAGIMYLYQSWRLKHRLPPNRGLKLPSLEWLERTNRSALLVLTGLLAIGLIAGFVVNLIQQTVSWSSPVVVSSGVLFVWLIVATSFEVFYKPARRGRKIAYLTVSSFVFLALVLFFVLANQHASNQETTRGPSADRSALTYRQAAPATRSLWPREVSQ